MKVAICVSGFPRIMKFTYPYLKKYILNQLDSYDIFYSGYIDNNNNILDTDILNTYSPKKYIIREYTESVKNEIWNIYGTMDVINIQPPTNPDNLLSQHYNIWKSNDLKKEYEKENNLHYDITFRIRTDYYFYKFPTLEELETKNAICIPSNGWDHGGYTDGFAFGESRLMDIYSNLFFNIKKYNIEHQQIFHPEKMLKYHLDINNIHRRIVGPHFCWRLQHFHENNLQDYFINDINKDPENFRSTYR